MTWRGPVTNMPHTILRPKEVQMVRRRLEDGQALTVAQALEILSSHEHLRAYALVARNRTKALEEEKETLLQTIRSLERAAK